MSGRNNRELLRHWKMQNDPEFRARVMKHPGPRVDPSSGRSLKYSNYADRHLLVMLGGDQHEPVLRWMHYDEIAQRNRRKNWISNKLTKWFGRNPDLEQRCWYTGVILYLVPYELRERLDRIVPWECSRDHLVCERNGGLGHGLSNLKITGRYFNKKMGHNPLPVKLLIRQELAGRSYDRDRPTWDAMRSILDHMIDIEDQHRLGAHYPWQPWAFDEGTRERKIAESFNAEMLREEQDFLSLDDEGRARWIEEFRWRW